ncbi:PREDICTED: uncharacterized protein LOC105362283 [Ceratosolen solmsi marchali]|uniref:Uncharacterized protein LOC105362283 n=1 Tax=Ceratosolen solmsi marchali TaxID=326594 RepID=A0AAJ6YH67_9HYME|nr:PREDICTED: uncharacterized protein LOC105362283 [Ceratosolen solmsi marchali]
MRSNHFSPAVLFIYLTIFNTISAKSIVGDQCTVNVKNGMNREHPPIVVKLSKPPMYVYPKMSNASSLVFQKGEKVMVFCPGRTNQNSTAVLKPEIVLVHGKEPKTPESMESIMCTGGDKFKIDDELDIFKQISCHEEPRMSYNAIMQNVNEDCVNGQRYEIGFDLKEHGFLKTIDLCHDKKMARTLWAHAIIQPTDQDQFRYSGDGAKSFKAGCLYDNMQMSKKEPYNLNVAYKTISIILKNATAVNKYLSTKINERKFLAKGHLIANADKMYRSEQESTYFYANAVPMWQQVNADPGNWFFVEKYVRLLAFHKQHELEVWVGGVSTLQLENKEIYLYYEKSPGKKVIDRRIPVPKVIFKCAVDKEAKEGLCFLVINNPYLTKTEVEAAGDKYIICKKHSLCEKLTNYDNGALGYMYCCSIQDFYVKNHEDVGVEDLKQFLNFKPMTLLTKEEIQIS